MSPLRAALLPLRHYADFGGRSTRTELIFFSLLVGAAHVAIGMAELLIGFAAAQWAVTGFDLAILVPALALGARRLHDTGRTGWWLLLLAAPLCLGGWGRIRLLQGAAPTAPPDFPLYVALPAALCSLALFILLLWDDEDGANRYGPNARLAEAGTAA